MTEFDDDDRTQPREDPRAALEHRVLADDHALELVQRAFKACAWVIELDPRRCLVVVVVHLHAIDCGERFVRSP